MAESGCATCKLRAKYDTSPKSFLGRLWRWHAGWCPGWNGYMKSLPAEDRRQMAEKYSMRKFL